MAPSEPTTSSISKEDPSSDILLRRATFADTKTMAHVSASTYWDTPFTAMLHPHRKKYPADYARVSYQSVVSRYLDPRVESWVACASENVKKPIGLIQFRRLGDDAGAKRQVARRWSVWLQLLGWFYFLLFFVQKKVWPDRSQNVAVQKQVRKEGKGAIENIWSKYPERWNVFNLVVLQEFQRRGVGKRLLRVAIDCGRADGKPVGLAASPVGERLYRSQGFELLARFEEDVSGDAKDAGGWMIWKPSPSSSTE